MAATIEELAALVRGRLQGDGTLQIRHARPVGDAGPGDITFVENERYARQLRSSPASAAIVGPHFKLAPPPDRPLTLIEVDDPISAFLQVRSHLIGDHRPTWRGIHPHAYVSASARIGVDVAIYPFAYIGDDCEVGDGCVLYPGSIVRERCKLGRDVVLHPNVVLYPEVSLGDRVEVHAGAVLGGDGFKYHLVGGKHMKVPHTGRLVVGNDVEIGSNTTIDRATFETSSVGEGTKIDNLVMVGHNNRIGNHNLLCGQVGIAGSCSTGDYVVLAGQAGVKDHTELGDRVVVGAQAGVHNNIDAGQYVLGSPAIPVREQRRLFQLIARLPEMHKQLRELSAKLAAMSPSGSDLAASSDADSSGFDDPSDPTGF